MKCVVLRRREAASGTQLDVSRCAPHREKAIVDDIVTVVQLLAAHVFVAGGHVALSDRESAGPAGNAVLVEADRGFFARDPVSRTGAATEAIDLIPGEMPTPRADQVPRRTPPTAAEKRESQVLHLVEMKDAWHADHQGKHTAQQSAPERSVLVAKAVLRGGQPTQGVGQQQEGAGVLRGREKNPAFGSGTGNPAARGWASLMARGSGPSAAEARLRPARSSPYFFMKWYRATVDTRTFQVRSMNSIISPREASGWLTRN